MPNFNVDTWTSFKEQFMSVVRFILYAFDLFFDACRSNPMLYMFLFFPIFAVAFFIVFDFVTKLIPGSARSAGGSKGSIAFRSIGTGSKSIKSASVNLAKAGKSSELKAATLAKIEKSNAKAAAKASGMNEKGLKSQNYGDTGFNVSFLVNKLRQRKENKRKEREWEEKVQSELVEVRRREQEQYDKSYNMTTDLFFSKDDEGNPVTTKTVTNSRTGEVVSVHDTVRHVND